MICGNCNEEIGYDAETVRKHLDKKCGGWINFPGEVVIHDARGVASFRLGGLVLHIPLEDYTHEMDQAAKEWLMKHSKQNP